VTYIFLEFVHSLFLLWGKFFGNYLVAVDRPGFYNMPFDERRKNPNN